MDITQLDAEFQQGSYKHYALAEYQFLRRFCELTKPRTITVVGGHTNLDLFYAVQECEPQVTNWDPGNTTSENTIRAQHDRFKAMTQFRGQYQWMPQSVDHLSGVDMGADLVWLNTMPSDIMEIEEWPNGLVFTHNGDLTQAGLVMQMARHIPMVALGRMTVIYSRQEHDWSHPTYRLRRDRHLGHINPVTEIVR